MKREADSAGSQTKREADSAGSQTKREADSAGSQTKHVTLRLTPSERAAKLCNEVALHGHKAT
jgi:hypothetical protein